MGLLSLSNAIGAREDSVVTFFPAAVLSVEEILDQKTFLDGTGGEEWKLFHARRLKQPLPTAKTIYDTTMSQQNHSQGGKERRTLPLGLVLGSSGSGKTFFSLQCLANPFLTTQNATKATIYCYAGQVPVKFTDTRKGNGANRVRAAKELAEWIQEELQDHAEDQEIHFPLHMHLCVIIDEAGSSETKAWFEDAKMLVALCNAIQKLATSVAVVVSGTGLTGRCLSSAEDAYIFRMKPWEARDLTMLLDQQLTPHLSLKQDKSETTTDVANAIFANPKLGALATNARAAYFMVKHIAELCSSYYTPSSWRLQLYEWTPTIFANVIASYMKSNSIKNLHFDQRCLVAASIFRALDEIKPYEDKILTLVGLQGLELTCAESLLEYHLDLVRGKPQLLVHENFAVTVTPAMAVILYAMTGVGATITNGWRAEEELAALYAVRQLLLTYMETYVSNGQNDRISTNKLKESLGTIRLVALDKQLKTSQTLEKPLLLPMVGKDAVLINRADKDPFANVIAPYMLIRAKQQQQQHDNEKPINLHKELEKCSLLRNGDHDTRLLQGLVQVWRGNVMPQSKRKKLSQKEKDQGPQPNITRKPQWSKAFPENLLHLVPEVERLDYARIEGNDIVIGKKKHPLPSLDGTEITFILSTNLDRIRLQLSEKGGHSFTISENNLDENLQIKVDTLSKSDRLAWSRFVEDQVRDGIHIKFLLTRSV